MDQKKQHIFALARYCRAALGCLEEAELFTVYCPEPAQTPAVHHHLRQTTHVSSHASHPSRRLVELTMAAMAAYLHRWTGMAEDLMITSAPLRCT
ncbi:hypothetical protein [Mycoavidus sp. SF9855]|uniref:hypothetical protein n=1 Tax=Mycoavidus sp. SF9855 TaxID=2968475 RepID=UPI00211BC307|nr:hypothetical protein [Mycoavidus sp. SF9855]UUM21222.1 hypothetical protein NQD60_07190 [Mycoavidus sp. SF9855]